MGRFCFIYRTYPSLYNTDMKLILASDQSFLLEHGYALTGISKPELNIGYITTAAALSRDKNFFEEIKQTIRDNGYKFTPIDIEGKSISELRDFFSDKNVIHIEGGNTFHLLKVIRDTNFAPLLRELLEEGKVYIGTSAGAYIMCPTIDVATWNESGKDRCGITDFTALNYVPFFIKAHYTDEVAEKLKEKQKTLPLPLRVLRDGQGIIVEDGEVEFVGSGEEVVLPTIN